MRLSWILRLVTATLLTSHAMAQADESNPKAPAVVSADQSNQESPDNLATIVSQWKSDRNADRESDPVTYLQRILAIAQSHRTSDEGCDAALWIVAKRPGAHPLEGPVAAIEREAIDLLAAHHANNIRVLSACCDFDGKSAQIATGWFWASWNVRVNTRLKERPGLRLPRTCSAKSRWRIDWLSKCRPPRATRIPNRGTLIFCNVMPTRRGLRRKSCLTRLLNTMPTNHFVSVGSKRWANWQRIYVTR